MEKIVAAVMADNEVTPSEEPNAVNLWHILCDEIEKRRTAHADGRESSWEDESNGTGGVPVHTTPDDHTPDEQALPVELDSKEIPYTHTNSLTGYANEVAELHSGTRHPDLLLADSAIYLAEAISPMSDNYTGYELAAMQWPLTPVSPNLNPPDPSVLGTENVIESDANTDSDDAAGSLAHYTSEQQLFEVEPTTPQSSTESSCDLETFLSMGHVENCWCRDCEEEPELVNDEWTTPLTESDGWMMWSVTEDGDSTTATAEPVVVADSNTNDGDGSFQTWTTAYCDWDDFYPSMAPQTPAPELEDKFLGYYDDGAAYTRESDNDWMWSF